MKWMLLANVTIQPEIASAMEQIPALSSIQPLLTRELVLLNS